MACLALGFGAAAGAASATAACGFGKNLRKDFFYRVQAFSFENIDRFSSASLVTRMTTDVSNVQNAYMMIIRVAVRSPLMFLFAIIMSYVMGGRLALMFVVVVPILAFGLILVVRKALPTFKRVFRRYDRLNESIAEKRAGHPRGQVLRAGGLRAAEVWRRGGGHPGGLHPAERIVAVNAPLMQFSCTPTW
jgi:ATP-binding cassette subfamily B protein